MQSFLGEYYLSLSGNRFRIPNSLYGKLNTDTLVGNRGFERQLNIYTINEWEKIAHSVNRLNIFEKNNREFIRYFLSGATQLLISKNQSILLPSHLIEYAGLINEIVLVGVGKSFEIFDKTNWEQYSKLDQFDLEELALSLLDESKNEITPGVVDEQILIQPSTIFAVSHINRYIYDEIIKNPSKIHQIKPREFEELIAEILIKLDYDVQLTKATVDGGVDIYAAINNDIGKFLYLVECKKYAEENKVGVETLQRLNGVVDSKKATAGLIVTTSSFTKPAVSYQKTVQHRLALADYSTLLQWINKVRGK